MESSNLNANFWNWFGTSKVVDENGKPLKVFHGSSRPDRIGTRFKKSRATSGPMPYFTSSPEIASSYATGKRDTSLDDNIEYSDWFKVKPKGGRSKVNIADYWYYLSYDKKKDIERIAFKINHDEETDKFFLGEKDGYKPFSSFMYDVRAAQGNHLRALVTAWLESGGLFNEEEKFLEVLKFLSLPDVVEYDSPHETYPGVFPVYLSMQNPIFSNNVPTAVKEALVKVAKKQKQSIKYSDGWNKDKQNPLEWITNLLNNYEYVWTSIPDWVTRTLQEMGYDGVIDSGLYSYTHDVYSNVYIPFGGYQVKSVFNKGTWSSSKKNMNEKKTTN